MLFSLFRQLASLYVRRTTFGRSRSSDSSVLAIPPAPRPCDGPPSHSAHSFVIRTVRPPACPPIRSPTHPFVHPPAIPSAQPARLPVYPPIRLLVRPPSRYRTHYNLFINSRQKQAVFIHIFLNRILCFLLIKDNSWRRKSESHDEARRLALHEGLDHEALIRRQSSPALLRTEVQRQAGLDLRRISDDFQSDITQVRKKCTILM